MKGKLLFAISSSFMVLMLAALPGNALKVTNCRPRAGGYSSDAHIRCASGRVLFVSKGCGAERV